MTRFLIILALIFSCFAPVHAGEGAKIVPESFRVTDYPLPRFVSIRAKEAFVRAGPGKKYPIKWVINKVGLPVEITLEFENWRKIKDYDGDEGWIHQSLLSGSRYALITADEPVKIFRKASKESSQEFFVEPLTVVRLEECDEAWCNINVDWYFGWVERKYIWGIYEDEIFD